MRGLIVFLSVGVLWAIQAWAYQVTPMYLEMEYVGRKAQSSYQVTNNTSQPVMLDVLVHKVSIDPETNQEISTAADEDFLILPPQAMVAPNTIRRFRVRYLGEGQVDSTQTYRVMFEQLQTNDGNETASQVKFLFNFSTVVFVSPTQDKCTRTLNAQVDSPNIVLVNKGNCVINIGQARLTFAVGDEETESTWSGLELENSSNYLIPKVTKKYVLPKELQGSRLVDINLN
ncbi:fimbrial biogenesis chaperone [Vibrio gallicus]|uniref:fimbrial biogenesis chaperone n=1 Tax=Vibrio gallicus TaxID=190897 RepID=UPI0021C306FE|nr:fimbria/pilus periplasmic chaperone [Vibrio gallicus]